MNTATHSASWTIDALLAHAMSQSDAPRTGQPPLVRVSRLEAILADVFEKGLASVAPRGTLR
jgi:hypothetical protein